MLPPSVFSACSYIKAHRDGVSDRNLAGIISLYRHFTSNGSQHADGFPCSRTASTQCFDCGSSLCESHTETCGICNGIFCPSCLSFHSVQHSRRISRPQGTSGTKKGLKITELRLRI